MADAVRGECQTFALERRRVGERARIGDRDAPRLEAQIVAAMVLRVELRPLAHRGNVVDRGFDDVRGRAR